MACNLRKYWQHRIIPALRLKHRSGGCGTASALPKCSIMSDCGTRIVLRGQKPLALCDRCPCFGSLFPPLAALTFAASSIICAFGLASAAPRSPYRRLELCGVAIKPLYHRGATKQKKRCPALTDWGQGRGTAETYSVMPQRQIDYSPISTRVTSGSFLGASFGKVNSRMPSVNLALTSLGCRSVPT